MATGTVVQSSTTTTTTMINSNQKEQVVVQEEPMTTPASTGSINVELDEQQQVALDTTLDGFAACFCCNPFDNNVGYCNGIVPDFVTLQGEAFDAIVVQSTKTGKVATSDFLIRFDHPSSPFPPPMPSTSTSTSHYHHNMRGGSRRRRSRSSVSFLPGGAGVNNSNNNVNNHHPHQADDDDYFKKNDICQALLEIHDDKLGKIYFPMDHDPIERKSRLRQPPRCDSMSRSFTSGNQQRQQQHADDDDDDDADDNIMVEQGTLQLLAKMLKPGKNNVRYLFTTNEKGILGVARASIYLWSDQDRIVVCDVDGTITKSNLRGIYDTLVTEKYGHSHDYVCEFLDQIVMNNKNGAGERKNDMATTTTTTTTTKGMMDRSCNDDRDDNDENLKEEHSPGSEQQQQQQQQPNINILYLSSRPWVIAEPTRRFLSNLRQSPTTPPPGTEATTANVRTSTSTVRRSILFRNRSSPSSSSSSSSSKSFNISCDVITEEKDNNHQSQPKSQRRSTITSRTLKGGATINHAPPHHHHHHRLPEGPLIGYPGRLSEVLKMELVTHDVHLFKAKTLLEQVVKPFCSVSSSSHDDGDDPYSTSHNKGIFLAGFGNTLMDVQAYHMAGMELSQIYLIDKKSRIHCLDGGGDDDADGRGDWEQQKQQQQQQEEEQQQRPPNQNDQDQQPASIKHRRKSRDGRTTTTSSSNNNINNNNDTKMDDCRPMKKEDEEGAKIGHLPVLKAPMNRKAYKKLVGTVFEGYRDEDLVSHVLRKGK